MRPGAALRAAWPRLHAGDGEPFPDQAWLAAALRAHPALAPEVDPAKAVAELQAAWRAYHAGDFRTATDIAAKLGPLGANAANKSANIHATYEVTDTRPQQELWLDSSQRAQALQRIAPDFPNAWYFDAQALGRYGQSITVARALAEGIVSRVRSALERTLALDPDHAEAHIAYGAFHAALVAKLGPTVARVTHAASAEAALAHFRHALRRLPYSAIAHIEYANAIAQLFGRRRLAEARALYREAAGCPAEDAMEALDVAVARAEVDG